MRLGTIFLYTSEAMLAAEELDVNKFHEVYQGKEISAKVVYLRGDETEGQKGDVGVVPAIKMALEAMPKTNLTGIELMAQINHLIMQDIATVIVAKDGSIGVDVWASPDFKRTFNKDPDSQVDAGDFNGYLMAPPDMDFWIVGSHHTFFSFLKNGAWTHIEGKFSIVRGAFFEFHVPTGTGFVYLKNFVVTP